MKRKGRKKNKGFSLIELIIAIAILVILTGILAPKMIRYIQKAREAKIIHACDEFSNAFKVMWSDPDNSSRPEIKASDQQQIWINYAPLVPVGKETPFEKYAFQYMKDTFGSEANKYLGVVYIDSNGNVISQLWIYMPDGKPGSATAAQYYVYLTNAMKNQETLQGPFNDTKWASPLTAGK